MLTLVFIKCLADVAFYSTFASFIAFIYKANVSYMMLTAFVLGGAMTLSYLLREKGVLRFAPILLVGLPVLLPAATVSGMIAMAPPTIYCIYNIAKKVYEPDWDMQTRLFSIFWKILIPFSIWSFATSNGAAYTAAAIPFAVITFVFSVLIMRSMRHEEEVFTQPVYQLVNVGVVGAVGIGAAVVSSKVFLNTVLRVVGFVYNLLIGPVLTLVSVLFAGFCAVFEWLLSFLVPDLSREEKHDLLANFNDMDIWQTLGEEESGPATFPARDVITAIFIIIAIILVILLFRKMSQRDGKTLGLPGRRELRSYASALEPEEEPAPGSPVAKVRAQYRKFLKMASKYIGEPLKSDTSLDVTERCEPSFSMDPVNDLRRIYIAARYNGKATKEDAKKAKELYNKIEKSAVKVKDE